MALLWVSSALCPMHVSFQAAVAEVSSSTGTNWKKRHEHPYCKYSQKVSKEQAGGSEDEEW